MKNCASVCIFFILLILLTGCNVGQGIQEVSAAEELTMVTPLVKATVENKTPQNGYPLDIPKDYFPPKIVPTSTPSERDKVLLFHETERLRRIEEQGIAESVPVLEYHSDDYRIPFPNGAVVELDPAGFESQMEWFQAEDVHAVTAEEIIQWIEGQIDLPKKSVVLTFDLGNKSMDSIYRIIPLLERTGMQVIFTIWVSEMEPNESLGCKGNACWEAYRYAYNSGYASLGSHTITHRDFTLVGESEGLKELLLSKEIIEDRTGGEVQALTWPFEAVPDWGEKINTVGFFVGFGGNTYPIKGNSAKRIPEDYFQIPRVLPPNSSGISGRPHPCTLEDMMNGYWYNEWKEGENFCK